MKNLVKKSVLIVDDNISDQILLSHQLKKIGFNDIHIGSNWIDAIKKVQEQIFDIILMDINMPIKNWIDATQEIRNLPTWKHPKIISYTANPFYNTDSNLENIFDGEIIKPAIKENINNEIKKVFKN